MEPVGLGGCQASLRLPCVEHVGFHVGQAQKGAPSHAFANLFLCWRKLCLDKAATSFACWAFVSVRRLAAKQNGSISAGNTVYISALMSGIPVSMFAL